MGSRSPWAHIHVAHVGLGVEASAVAIYADLISHLEPSVAYDATTTTAGGTDVSLFRDRLCGLPAQQQQQRDMLHLTKLLTHPLLTRLQADDDRLGCCPLHNVWPICLLQDQAEPNKTVLRSLLPERETLPSPGALFGGHRSRQRQKQSCSQLLQQRHVIGSGNQGPREQCQALVDMNDGGSVWTV